MKEFYQNLKKKRLEKKLPLEEIHQMTRLPLHYLEAIEAGEMETLPKAYERMYLRRYAKAVGLDPDEVIRDYDLITGRLTATARPLPVDIEAPVPEAPPRPAVSGPKLGKMPAADFDLARFRKFFWIGLGTIIIAISGYFVYRQVDGAVMDSPPAIKEITIGELIEQQNRAETTQTSVLPVEDSLSSAESIPEASAKVNIELRGLQRVWIREVRDQRDTSEYILTPGLRRSLSAIARVDLTLGRADGVEIFLNGASLGSLGTQNQVALLTLTPAGITRKNLRNIRQQSAAAADSAAVDSAAVKLNVRQ